MSEDRSPTPPPAEDSAPPASEATDAPGPGNLGNGSSEVKLYIGNIDYGTTDASLRAYFEKHGTVTDAFVPTERGTNKPRGFGFVTFSTREEANNAIQNLDGTMLEGRTIRISESKPREKSNGPFNPQGNSEVKLFVGNLSFETTTAKIQNLFETIGKVHDCYAPTDRSTGRPRGFAFVTMPSREAEEAMNKLTGHDLDGRAIRIEEAGGKKNSRDDGFRGGMGMPGDYGRGYGGPGFGDRYGGDRYGDRGYDRGYDRGGHDRGSGHGDRRRDYDDRRDYDRDRRSSRDRYDDRRRGGRSRSRSPGYRRRDYDDRRSRSPPRRYDEGDREDRYSSRRDY